MLVPRARALGFAVGASMLASMAVSATAPAQTALPDDRVYERVSQAETNGRRALQTGTSVAILDDDTVLLSSGPEPTQPEQAGAAGSYRFSRTATGWTATSLLPPDVPTDRVFRLLDTTTDGSTMVFIDTPVEQFTAPPERADGARITVRDADGTLTTIAQDPNLYDFNGTLPAGTNYLGISADGQTIAVSRYVAAPDDPNGFVRRAQTWTRAGGLVDVAPAVDDPTAGCSTDVPGGAEFGLSQNSQRTNAISGDGSTVFLQVGDLSGANAAGCGTDGQLVVSRNGTTLPVSRLLDPVSGPEYAARFVGATPDGDVAYFTTATRLVDEDVASPTAGASNAFADLYRWTAPTATTAATVECVSCGVSSPVGNRNVGPTRVKVSRDASSVFFTAGADARSDTYVARGGTVSRVDEAVVDTGFGISPDGRRIAYAKTAPGQTDQRSVWTATVSDTGEVATTCLTCAPDGTPRDGGEGGSVLYLNPTTGTRGTSGFAGSDTNAVAADGTVVFASANDPATGEPLAAPQVYRWRPGQGVAPVFNAGTTRPQLAAVSDSGRTLFGFSYDRLTADATQDALTLFAARVGGGFAPPAAPAAPCEGEACAGAPLTPTAPPAPATTGPAGGNVGAPPAAPATVRPSLTLRAPTRADRRRLARTGRVALRLRARGDGRIRVRARARVRGRTRTVASGSGRATATLRTVRVTLRLSSAARAKLRRSGRLRVTVRATLSGARTARTTVVVTRKA